MAEYFPNGKTIKMFLLCELCGGAIQERFKDTFFFIFVPLKLFWIIKNALKVFAEDNFCGVREKKSKTLDVLNSREFRIVIVNYFPL